MQDEFFSPGYLNRTSKGCRSQSQDWKGELYTSIYTYLPPLEMVWEPISRPYGTTQKSLDVCVEVKISWIVCQAWRLYVVRLLLHIAPSRSDSGGSWEGPVLPPPHASERDEVALLLCSAPQTSWCLCTQYMYRVLVYCLPRDWCIGGCIPFSH